MLVAESGTAKSLETQHYEQGQTLSGDNHIFATIIISFLSYPPVIIPTIPSEESCSMI